MSGNEVDTTEIAKWDPAFTKRVITVMTPVVKRWFRAEVRGLESFPSASGALVVSNHSGGVLPPDWNILAPAFYGRFGYHRPLYTLAHYGVLLTPLAGSLGRLGVIHASRDNAAQALRSGAVVLDFPGGDYDAFRPTVAQNVIDFDGRTGYVRTAMETGVPIVPAVSIGGQETQPRHRAGEATGPQADPDGDSAGYRPLASYDGAAELDRGLDLLLPSLASTLPAPTVHPEPPEARLGRRPFAAWHHRRRLGAINVVVTVAGRDDQQRPLVQGEPERPATRQDRTGHTGFSNASCCPQLGEVKSRMEHSPSNSATSK